MSPVVRNNLATQPHITHADNSPEFSAVLDRCHSSLHVSFVVTPAGGAAPAKQGHNADASSCMRRTQGILMTMPQPFTLSFLLIILVKCRGTLIDVHLPLKLVQNSTTDLCPYHQALEANLRLRQLSIKEEIDFFTLHTPHITLYQADFDIVNKTDEFINATAEAIESIKNAQPWCHISWPNASASIVSHDYAMYPIFSNNDCLQSLSHHIVKALKGYIHRPPIIPDWVYSLPREQRQRALALIQTYGSPNVMERFQPHVTVGYDAVYPSVRRKRVLDSLTTPNTCQANLAVVSIANVGVGGSVLQDGVISNLPLDSNRIVSLSLFSHKGIQKILPNSLS